MDELTALIDRYFAAWNETDDERRRDLIARTYTEDAVYVDPLVGGEGRPGIDAMIQGVQQQFPGLRFRRAGTIDSHRDRARFAWELGPEGGAAAAGGVDFVTLTGGRLRSVTGFVDFAPEGLVG